MVLAALLANMGSGAGVDPVLSDAQQLSVQASDIAGVSELVANATIDLIGGAEEDGCYDGLISLHLGVGTDPRVNYIIPSTNTEDGYLTLFGGAAIGDDGIDLESTSDKAYTGIRATNIYDQANIGFTKCTKHPIGPSNNVSLQPVEPDGDNEPSAGYYLLGYGLDSKAYAAVWASSAGIVVTGNEAGYHDFQRIGHPDVDTVEYRTNSDDYSEEVAVGSISDDPGGVALVGDGVAQTVWIFAIHQGWDTTKSNAWRARCLAWLSAVKSYIP